MKINLPNCEMGNSLLEPQLSEAVKQGMLGALQVMESEDGYFVVIKLLLDINKTWYLTTRRERDNPRLFKDLNRLFQYLKETLPNLEKLEIYCNQPLPPNYKP